MTMGDGKTGQTAAGGVPSDAIVLDRVTFGYQNGVTILNDLSLRMEPGEFFTLIGPSGCGKTTILRLVAGLLAPLSGRILIGERDVTHVPTHRRGIGLVFQNYALFPHMTVAENVAYGLRMQGATQAVRAAAVEEALGMVGLPGVGARYPGDFSGGQQQRIGLARAVAAKPRVMLLDEPLSNLDAKLREQMCIDIAALQRRLGITMLYVTHDQGEALAMSDRLAIMNKGRVHELGAPREVYENPTTRVGAGFLGNMNTFELRRAAPQDFRTASGLRVVLAHGQGDDSAELTAMIRPEKLRVMQPGLPPGSPNRFEGLVETCVYRGAFQELFIRVPGLETPIQALSLAQGGFATGSPVAVEFDSADLHLLQPEIA